MDGCVGVWVRDVGVHRIGHIRLVCFGGMLLNLKNTSKCFNYAFVADDFNLVLVGLADGGLGLGGGEDGGDETSPLK